MAPVSVTTIHRVSEARTKEGKEDDDPGVPVSFLILLFSFSLSLLYCLGCNLPFPLNYKRGSRVSRRGTTEQHIHTQPT
jgi:hypothetical protein